MLQSAAPTAYMLQSAEKPEFFYSKEDELTLDGWKAALSALEALGVRQVGISGGEPLLKDCLVGLLRHIRERTGLNEGQGINVVSNGKLMDEDTLSVFMEIYPSC